MLFADKEIARSYKRVRLARMKLIDAFWDTRNLGRRTAELEFAETWNENNVGKIKEAIADYQYLAAKVPVSNHKAIEALQARGFRFVECSISLRNNLLSSAKKGLLHVRDSVAHHLVTNPEEQNEILNQVRKGLFFTDRISLDEHFGIDVASNRYSNWILDELSGSAELYSVTLENQMVGFFAYKETLPQTSYPFLIGLFPEFRSKGLGSSLVAESLITSIEHGCSVSETVVSSNNPAVIRCQESVGSFMHGIRYVFVRHS